MCFKCVFMFVLTHVRPKLLFTLIFSYKKDTHHIKQLQGINIEKSRGEEKKIRIQGSQGHIIEESNRVIWIHYLSFFTYSFFTL